MSLSVVCHRSEFRNAGQMGHWAMGRNQGGPPHQTDSWQVRAGTWWHLSGVSRYAWYVACVGVHTWPGPWHVHVIYLPFSLSIQGVAQLADISLLNPVSISVLEEGYGQANPQGGGALEVSAPQTSDELDSFAIPEGLDQHVTLVPSKLRLVSLAAFILQKCAVGLGTGPGSIEGTETCSCRALVAAWRHARVF